MKETKIYIGIGLKRLRKEKGWTIEELESKAKLTRKYIYELEHNLKSPSGTTLDDLAKAFEMKFGDFINEIDDEII
ncbi:transcriptional regulator with XRE-family HTH domain [Neobacillus niacini]|uniref:helix-turn-helix domain-containing protein n=1 Tax=Neobacillus niacini TaxID=86668 RepID=UPI00277F5B06|nr:helix-turn-helix transcriptional regulator [Neobacillus niacini]MDQ1000394.1 transcriptional regulator with XRE-family HTH domain [Neobacillus niacini]